MELDLKRYMQRIQLISAERAQDVVTQLDKTNWVDFDYHGPENICVQDNPVLPYQVTNMEEPELAKVVDKAVDNYIENFLNDIPWFSYWNGKT